MNPILELNGVDPAMYGETPASAVYHTEASLDQK